ncbi:hypothetical protein NL676_029630 [Syzygium grande]|nr:hypothetical protein NL676_029630 [Syzygium grande]
MPTSSSALYSALVANAMVSQSSDGREAEGVVLVVVVDPVFLLVVAKMAIGVLEVHVIATIVSELAILRIIATLYIPSFVHRMLMLICVFQDLRTGRMIGGGHESNGLYYLNKDLIATVVQKSTTIQKSTASDFFKMHCYVTFFENQSYYSSSTLRVSPYEDTLCSVVVPLPPIPLSGIPRTSPNFQFADKTYQRCRPVQREVEQSSLALDMHDSSPIYASASNPPVSSELDPTTDISIALRKVTGLHDMDEFVPSQLILALKLFFPIVTFAKPKSSRNSSIEAFAVCENYSPPEGFNPKDLHHLLEKIGNPSGVDELDCSSGWLEGPNKANIPFLACGDLSGYGSDRSYPLPKAPNGTYQSLNLVQPPVAPPYKRALELKKASCHGVQELKKLSFDS